MASPPAAAPSSTPTAASVPGKKLLIVGCGSMGSAILNGLLEGVSAEDAGDKATPPGPAPISSITACVRSEASVQRLGAQFGKHADRVTFAQGDIVRHARSADVVLVATKPYMLKAVLGAAGMGDAVRGKLVLSVLAGISPALILEALYGNLEDSQARSPTMQGDGDGERPPPPPPPQCHVVQATLNLAARIRSCTTVLNDAALRLPQPERQITQWVFGQIGEVRYLPESMMPVAAVLAAIPAIASVALDGMLDGCVAQGVVRAQAREIAALNLIGLGKLLLGDGGDGVLPEQLREATSSPRGVTIQALLELERGRARATFADAFIVASEHARKMAAIQD